MQPVYNIAEICAQKGIREAILSPGSRCAPITIAFARHSSIKVRTITDERSAAFIATGIAQTSANAVVLVCTSGSAAYNYAPAVSEAFFSNVPLIVITADRPPEWIDQWDGQTIRQNFIFGNHVKKSYNLPDHYDHPDVKWHFERIINEAINVSLTPPFGPVHLNIPLREPFYPADGKINFEKNIKIAGKIIGSKDLPSEAWQKIEKAVGKFRKILVLSGQNEKRNAITPILEKLSAAKEIVIAGDIISNQQSEKILHHHDVFLAGPEDNNVFCPELVITYGRSLISKTLKLLLRKNPALVHWHIGAESPAPDPFKSLQLELDVDPATFFEKLNTFNINTDPAFKRTWETAETWSIDFLKKYFSSEKPFNEFDAVDKILKNLPRESLLHLANSMPVRYANICGINDREVEIFANRGTSGIDGTNSTALGSALVSDKIVTVLTGDVAFFYDRNALWNNYVPENLKIIILNNHGGGIFRIIEGPSKLPELDEFFETKQMLNAELTAKDHGLAYYSCNNAQSLSEGLSNLYSKPGAAILEIFTDSKINAEIFGKYKKRIKEEWKSKF